MRRFLAIIGLILVIGGFVMIPISIWKNINFLIPVGLIVGSFLILLLVKQMEPDEDASADASDDKTE